MSNDLFSLNGKVALVTGSSTGLGKVMARALGRAGAKVAQNYENEDLSHFIGMTLLKPSVKNCRRVSNMLPVTQ